MKKKVVCLVIVFAMMISATGCHSNSGSASSVDKTVASSQTGCHSNGGSASSDDKTIASSQNVESEKKNHTLVYREKLSFDGIPIGICEDRITMLLPDGQVLTDLKGNPVSENIFEWIGAFDEKDRAVAFTLDYEYVYIDRNANVLGKAENPLAYDDTQLYVATGTADSDSDTVFGIKDSQGKRLTEPIFAWVSTLNNKLNFATLSEGEHRNVMITQRGEIAVVLPDDCEHANVDGDRIICWYYNEREVYEYRLADMNGNLLNQTAFSGISNFSDSTAAVIVGTKMGLINKNGEIIVEPSIKVAECYNFPPVKHGNLIAYYYDGNNIVVEIVEK